MDRCISSLSTARKKLLELIDETHFGRIEATILRGEPDFSQPPTITKEIKLGLARPARSERNRAYFAIKSQFIELFDQLDRLRDGSIVTIEVRHSLPARLIVAERCD